MEGRIDGGSFDDEVLAASIEEVYADGGPEDYTTGVAGGLDGSMHPQQALMAAETDDDSSDALDDYETGVGN